MLEADVVVVGAGRVGMEAALSAARAGASVVALDKLPTVPASPKGVDVRGDAMALDVILSEHGEAAGLVVASQSTWSVEPVRARAVVLATGGIDALYPGGARPLATGDGLLLAHRAGAALVDLRVRRAASGAFEVAGGVASDSEGATRVPGLLVAGALSAARVAGAQAGAAAARVASNSTPRAFGPYAMMPTIDSPLPRGFASVKMDRLRAILAARGPGDELAALHRLKGEADEFARARVDVELLSFKNACEVAILLARSV